MRDAAERVPQSIQFSSFLTSVFSGDESADEQASGVERPVDQLDGGQKRRFRSGALAGRRQSLPAQETLFQLRQIRQQFHRLSTAR